jgi:hypothetical protein
VSRRLIVRSRRAIAVCNSRNRRRG